MYIVAQPHKCQRCGHEMKYGPHDHYNKSPITEAGNPICPVCWNEFLNGLGAEMLCTIAWSPKGSEYGQKMKDKQ